MRQQQRLEIPDFNPDGLNDEGEVVAAFQVFQTSMKEYLYMLLCRLSRDGIVLLLQAQPVLLLLACSARNATAQLQP